MTSMCNSAAYTLNAFVTYYKQGGDACCIDSVTYICVDVSNFVHHDTFERADWRRVARMNVFYYFDCHRRCLQI
jgi:hypothetical protein